MPRTTRRKRILWTSDELKLLKQLAGKVKEVLAEPLPTA